MLVKNPVNKGVAFSLNVGIQTARDLPDVKFIARMDSDDICLKDRLLQQVNFMELNPQVDICGTNMIILKQNSEPKIISMPSHD